ncbi:MAG: histidine kinase [Melioribacteraceae bacterium]|nr:histidine kinase [Melioribacteraceae bacterium]
MNIDIFLSPSRSLRIKLHVLFWVCVLFFFTFFYFRLGGNIYYTFIHLLFTFPIYIGATYTVLYHLIPKFLLQKRYKKFIVWLIYIALATAYLEIIITIVLLTARIQPAAYFKEAITPTSLDIYLRLIGIFMVVFFASSIKLLKHWLNAQRINQQLIKEKLEAELNMLKSQVHPHFLFNTLNNLYALTLNKSDKSPEVVLKLSAILDYILYQCNDEVIPVQKEIELIQNYIDLEKLRYGDRAKIEFEVTGLKDVKMISPLILFPFIENAFKHGISKISSGGWIKIKLNSSADKIMFRVSNSCANDKVDPNNSSGNGIGLGNVRKRLELIYRDHYKLNINRLHNQFNAELTIDLKNRTGN